MSFIEQLWKKYISKKKSDYGDKMIKLGDFKYTKPVIIIAISLLIISSSALIIENVEASSEEVPRWVEGDYWEYNRTKGEQSLSYTMRVSSEEEVIDIDGTHFECYMVNYTWIIEGVPEMETHFYTKDGLSLVAQMSEDETYAYNPTVNSMDFPLEEGKEWTSSYLIWKQPEDGGTWTQITEEPIDRKYIIDGRETVNTPAGTFETYIINMTQADDLDGNRHVLNYYSPEVNNMVMVENFQMGGLTDREELIEYNLEEREEEEEDIPYLGAGVVFLSIGASTLVYLCKKKIKKRK